MSQFPNHHWPVWAPTLHPWRERPAEYRRTTPFAQGGWWQEGHTRRVRKPHYHFIWPKDGKNGSKWGRVKDILANRGPDIHVTISADKRDYMHNRQRRARWANWTELDDRGPDGALWDGIGEKKYNFWTRKYEHPHIFMATDAIYQDGNGSSYPHAVRDWMGDWWQDISFEQGPLP